jgi:hypothetical protein
MQRRRLPRLRLQASGAVAPAAAAGVARSANVAANTGADANILSLTPTQTLSLMLTPVTLVLALTPLRAPQQSWMQHHCLRSCN